MIDSTMVGVKLPDSRSPEGVDVGFGVALAVEVGVALGVAVGVGFGVALGVAVAEGVDSKAGPSAAWTTKVLVNVLVIPAESFHIIVIL